MASALFGLACSADPGAPVGPPNVVLISIDSLRADHVHAYGYPRRTTPNLDRLAEQGVLFETVVADTSWTLPSHLTLLTGLSSRVHGVTFDGLRLDPARTTLAERLRAGGWRTAGIVSAPYLHPVFGFAQGFEHYRVVGDTVYDREGFVPGITQSDRRWEQTRLRTERAFHEARSSPELAARFAELVDEWKDERFFLFVHLFDVHYDYDPPERYWRRFDPKWDGDLDPSRYYFNPRIHPKMPPRELRHVIARYDGEILWTDEWVGRMLEALDEAGLEDDTLVVVVSDHGEEFFEHGRKGHRENLFDESLLVPWIMRWPRGLEAGVRVASQVRLEDVAPTILELAGLPAGDEATGRSAVPLLDGREERDDREALSTLVWPETAHWVALRTPQWKLVEIETPDPAGHRSYWFDLGRDAAERKPLRSGPEHEAATLALAAARDVADGVRERLPSGGPHEVALDPAMREALEALGYLETPPAGVPGAGAGLPAESSGAR
ncbi:MAG: sulfatase [Myxococcota bacterium]|nr:sulfatase [Myxococcota bacterium]